MEDFQGLLTEAAQLKEHQLRKERKKFQRLPDFLKSGLSYQKKYENVRKQDFLYQLHVSTKLKNQGNCCYHEGKYEEALHKYEEGLSIFRYIQSSTFENMKDENMKYEQFASSQLSSFLKQKYKGHLIALYSNITSSLTKLNKKDDALVSAEEGLKLQKTAKGHYKKAQAYLQYINRNEVDIKLGFSELSKAYELSSDKAILKEMYKIKKQIEDERSKEKHWFKFMFDKNSKEKKPLKSQSCIETSEDPQNCENKEQSGESKAEKSKEEKKLEELLKREVKKQDQVKNLQKTKQKLQKYVKMDEGKWLCDYQQNFIERNGSKIFVLLKISNYKSDIESFKLLLVKCGQLKKSNGDLEIRKKCCEQFINWMKMHPLDSIMKYIERYDLQTKWILQQRQKINKVKKEKIEKKEHILLNVKERRQESFVEEERPQPKQQSNFWTILSILLALLFISYIDMIYEYFML